MLDQVTRTHPKHPTIDDVTYPRTHAQAASRIHQCWQRRDYATAADYAALAHTLANEAGDLVLAANYAKARQLAYKYHALKVEMNKIAWQVATDPILEPDDPPSSEARCNMVCTPHRPRFLHDQDIPHPGNPGLHTLRKDDDADDDVMVNQSQPIFSCNQPTQDDEMDIDRTVCCLPMSCTPWRRKR